MRRTPSPGRCLSFWMREEDVVEVCHRVRTDVKRGKCLIKRHKVQRASGLTLFEMAEAHDCTSLHEWRGLLPQVRHKKSLKVCLSWITWLYTHPVCYVSKEVKK